MNDKRQYYCKHMLLSSLIPSFISAFALSIADIVDSVVLGNRMGENGLAAIGIVTPVYMLYNILGYGLSRGGEITNSRLVASGQTEEARKHFNELLWSGIFCGVIIAIAGVLFSRGILFVFGASGQDARLFTASRHYYIPLIAAAPLFIANYIFYDLLRSDGDQYLASLAFTVSCILDVGLNILFVLVFGLGITGSISATLIAQAVETVICLFHFIRKRGLLGIFAPRLSVKTFISSFALGFSTSVRYLFQLLFLTLANNLFVHRGGDKGSLYVAIFDVVMNVSFVAYALLEGTGEALQPLCSAFYEEKDRNSLDYCIHRSMLIGVASASAVVFLIALFARQTAFLFGITDPESLKVAVYAIRIFCVSVPFAGVMIIPTYYYQCVGKERLSAAVTILRNCIILLPAAYVIGILRLDAFWFVFPLTELISLLLAFLYLRFTGAGQVLMDVPVMSATLENDDHEIAVLLQNAERFCEENHAAPAQENLLMLAVEEIVIATIAQAFTGKAGEYIQVTLVADSGDRFVLLIRNSARRFNPFDMKTARVTRDNADEFLDSIGIHILKRKAKEFYYRRNNNFNILTLVI